MNHELRTKSLFEKSIFGHNRPYSAAHSSLSLRAHPSESKTNHSAFVTVSRWIQLLTLHIFLEVNNSVSKETFRTGSNYGYTFVELLVVTSVFLVIMGTVGGLFFSSLRGTTKITLTNEAKQNGDFAINILERNVKNARSIVNAETVCNNTNTKVTTLDVIASDGSGVTLRCPALGTSGSISVNTEVLTSSKVSITDCYFICSRATPNSPPLAKIHFTIGQALSDPNVTLRPDERISIDYETSVQIRNVGF